MDNKKKRLQIIIVGIVIFFVLIIVDQLSKIAAVNTLKAQEPKALIGELFQLQYLENHGAAFGILQGQRGFLLIITIVILFVVFYIYFRSPADKRFNLLRFVLILIVAGAVGNMIDRIRQAYVVDFFYIKVINFPIFNVADIYVTVGAILLVVSILFFYKDADYKMLSKSLRGKK